MNHQELLLLFSDNKNQTAKSSPFISQILVSTDPNNRWLIIMQGQLWQKTNKLRLFFYDKLSQQIN